MESNPSTRSAREHRCDKKSFLRAAMYMEDQQKVLIKLSLTAAADHSEIKIAGAHACHLANTRVSSRVRDHDCNSRPSGWHLRSTDIQMSSCIRQISKFMIKRSVSQQKRSLRLALYSF